MCVVWTKRVVIQRLQQEKWLAEVRGIDFARTFDINIDKAIAQISVMPDIGQKERALHDGKCLRSVLTHPKCRIIYSYNETTVVILRLKFMMMGSA